MVARDGYVGGDGHVWLQSERAGAGALEAYLFLYRSDSLDGSPHGPAFEQLEGRDQHGAAGAVVEGFAGDQVRAESKKLAVDSGGATDLDTQVGGRRGAGGAAVDEHVLDLDDLPAFFGIHEVRRPRAHHTGDAAPVSGQDEDALPQDGLIGPSAHGDHSQEPFVVDVGDHGADLIHVRGDHHRRTVARAHADDVAHLVDGDLVHERLHLPLEQGRHFVFIAGEAVSVGE